MKKIKLAIFTGILFPLSTFSQGFQIKNPIDQNSIPEVLTDVLNFVLVPIATVLLTIMVVFYGTKLVMSQGKPTEVAEAKKMLFWALVGGFVILGAGALTQVITNTTSGLSS